MKKAGMGLAMVMAVLIAAPMLLTAVPSPAAEDLKIALVVPLSGRWARQGQLKKMGAEMAIAEVNAQGGIKSLGGAKIVLREADAGDSVEKAVSAAQRALTREKISAGMGSWLISFPLGVTGVAERLEVPWFTLSYADSITDRGFKYTFQSSPVSSAQAEQALEQLVEIAKRNNQPIKKAAIIGDNPAATVFFFKPLREKLLKAKGIEIVVDEIWTPPLADATAIVQKLRSTQPDVVFYGATNFPDSIQVLQKVKEFGVKSPIQGVGAWLVTPEYVKAVGPELLDSIKAVVAAHPLKGQDELVKRFKERTGEPFMTQDPLMSYAHVWIIKEAAERAKSTDPKAIRDAVAKLDLTSGPAASALAPGRIRYDDHGRRIGAIPIIVQWQGGEPLLGAVLLLPPFFLLGVAVHRVLLARVTGGGDPQRLMDTQLILTLGLSLIITNGTTMLLTPMPRAIKTTYATQAFAVGPVLMNEARSYAFVMALLLAGVVYVFLTRTDLGKALRAAADEPEAAGYQGIDVRAMHGLAFGVGIALVAAAGGLLATYHPIEPTVAVNFIVLMFVAVVLGGLGSIPGAFAGGLLIGLVQSLTLLVLPFQLQNVGVFITFLLVLYLRPQGLFGQRLRAV